MKNFGEVNVKQTQIKVSRTDVLLEISFDVSRNYLQSWKTFIRIGLDGGKDETWNDELDGKTISTLQERRGLQSKLKQQYFPFPLTICFSDDELLKFLVRFQDENKFLW